MFLLEKLPYDYIALEPYIDTQTMYIHHDKHLQTYIDNLNATLKSYPQYQNWSLEELIRKQKNLPEEIQTPVRNNAGGVYNHNLYFEGMAPAGTTSFSGTLADAILKTYGSYENFLAKLKAAALGQFGSGWAWLVSDKKGRLQIISIPNQDTPLTMNLIPILLVDVWEHAYYLKYQNLRASYFDNWTKVINWDIAEKRYQSNIQQ